MNWNFGAIESLAGFAILGTVFGAILRGWSSIKGFFQSIFRLVVIQANLEDNKTSQVVLSYLVKNYKRSTIGIRTFGGKHESLKTGKYGHIPYEYFGDRNIVFWKGWIPFWYSVVVEKEENKSITWGEVPKKIKCSVHYIRWTLDVEKIIESASEDRNKLYWDNSINSEQKRFFIKKIPDPNQPYQLKHTVGTDIAWYYEGIYKLMTYNSSQLGKSSENINGKAVDNLYFPPSTIKMIEEVKLWRGLQDWYKQRGIPWKRGWILYGPPGTGKSAVTRAIAEDLDLPLFVFSLGNMINEDLEKSWSELQTHIPCIALFEDFDNVFKGRENIYGRAGLEELLLNASTGAPTAGPEKINKRGGLSFDCLLNCIDGVEKNSGVFTIITTNHIDTIDPALGQPRKNKDGSMEFISTRPGRIDKAIELGYMEIEDKIKLAQRIFIDDQIGYEKIYKIIQSDPNKKETPAQVQEVCTQIALESIWNKQHNVTHHRNGNVLPSYLY